jgi:hypothetical protein
LNEDKLFAWRSNFKNIYDPPQDQKKESLDQSIDKNLYEPYETGKPNIVDRSIKFHPIYENGGMLFISSPFNQPEIRKNYILTERLDSKKRKINLTQDDIADLVLEMPNLVERTIKKNENSTMSNGVEN